MLVPGERAKKKPEEARTRDTMERDAETWLSCQETLVKLKS